MDTPNKLAITRQDALARYLPAAKAYHAALEELERCTRAFWETLAVYQKADTAYEASPKEA